MPCPRISTASKSPRSKASSIAMTFCLQFCRKTGIMSANLGFARTRIVSFRLLSSFDDRGATMERSLIACSSTSCLIGFVKKAAPCRQTHFSIALQGRGGQCDDRRGRPVVRMFPRSNCPRRGQAIHDRHLPVHQDKVIVSSYKLFTGDGPGLGDVDPVRRVLQIGHRDRAVVGRVLRQKNVQRRQRRLRIRSGRGGRRPTSRAQISNGTAKANTLPSPTLLSTQMRPPISSTRRFEIVSPSPEPPNLRVVDESACVKRS